MCVPFCLVVKWHAGSLHKMQGESSSLHKLKLHAAYWTYMLTLIVAFISQQPPSTVQESVIEICPGILKHHKKTHWARCLLPTDFCQKGLVLDSWASLYSGMVFCSSLCPSISELCEHCHAVMQVKYMMLCSVCVSVNVCVLCKVCFKGIPALLW